MRKDPAAPRRLSRPASPETAVELGNGNALRTGDHAAFLYREPADLLALVVPYLIEGIRANDKVVYVADDLDVAAVRDALLAAGVDVESESARGRLTLASSTDAFFPGGRFDVETAIEGVRTMIADARRAGYRCARFSVEMTYLLRDVPGIERGLEFEARVNDEVFAGNPIVCICSFNEKRDDGRVLVDVLRSHRVLIREGDAFENPWFVRWRDGAATAG